MADTVTVIPSWVWEVDVTNDPSSVTTTWDDITAFVRGASIKRGRQVETARDQAGTCQLSLHNVDRRFDPFYSGAIRNLIPNPSVENNLTGYTALSSSLARNAVAALFGAQGLVITTTNVATSGPQYGDATPLLPVTPGLAYCFSAYVKRAAAGSTAYRIQIDWHNAADGVIATNTTTFTLNWTSYASASARQFVTATAPALAHHVRIFVLTNAAGGVFDVHTDGWQFELGSAPTAYNDGDQDNGRWEGTPHASRSFFGAPYYPNVKPMRRVRCRATYSATTYPIYYGYLDDPTLQYDGPGDAVLNVSATDGFKVLANKLISGDFPAQRSDLRVAAILDAAGWPAALRSLATGVSFLDPITLDKVSALEHIQQVADSESGRFFMDASGNAKFIDRHAAYLTTSSATFGESEILYRDVVFGGSDQLIYNEIICQRTDGEARSAVDATSQAAFLTRSLSHTGLLIDNDNESENKADFELALFKDFHPRIVALLLDGTADPGNVWPQALGRELGDRLTVRKRPPGGGALIEQESFIEGIEHSVGVGTWDTAVRLSTIGIGYQIYAAGKAFLVLGNATTAALTTGTGVLTY